MNEARTSFCLSRSCEIRTDRHALRPCFSVLSCRLVRSIRAVEDATMLHSAYARLAHVYAPSILLEEGVPVCRCAPGPRSNLSSSRAVVRAGQGIFRGILGIFRGIGLTKRGNGCILYNAGSEKGRCSPQNDAMTFQIWFWMGPGTEEKSKNLSKPA